ncbi:270_t:CDS:2, partial [Gigaspora rosea]
MLLELESNISEGDDDMGSEIFGTISSTVLIVCPACTAPQDSEVLWLSQKSKKIHNNNNDLLLEERQWIDIGNNKTSRVWKHFGVKTDGCAYCRYIINQDEAIECGWNC